MAIPLETIEPLRLMKLGGPSECRGRGDEPKLAKEFKACSSHPKGLSCDMAHLVVVVDRISIERLEQEESKRVALLGEECRPLFFVQLASMSKLGEVSMGLVGSKTLQVEVEQVSTSMRRGRGTLCFCQGSNSMVVR